MWRWIVFGCVAVVLGGAAWHFGRPEPAPTPPTFAVATAPAPEVSEQAPANKVIEIIDLSRAYEPVREPDEPAAGVFDPVQFLPEPGAPARMPLAAPEPDAENPFTDILRVIQESPTGPLLLGAAPPAPVPERINVMPREVSTYERIGDIGP